MVRRTFKCGTDGNCLFYRALRSSDAPRPQIASEGPAQQLPAKNAQFDENVGRMGNDGRDPPFSAGPSSGHHGVVTIEFAQAKDVGADYYLFTILLLITVPVLIELYVCEDELDVGVGLVCVDLGLVGHVEEFTFEEFLF